MLLNIYSVLLCALWVTADEQSPAMGLMVQYKLH